MAMRLTMRPTLRVVSRAWPPGLLSPRNCKLRNSAGVSIPFPPPAAAPDRNGDALDDAAHAAGGEPRLAARLTQSTQLQIEKQRRRLDSLPSARRRSRSEWRCA